MDVYTPEDEPVVPVGQIVLCLVLLAVSSCLLNGIPSDFQCFVRGVLRTVGIMVPFCIVGSLFSLCFLIEFVLSGAFAIHSWLRWCGWM